MNTTTMNSLDLNFNNVAHCLKTADWWGKTEYFNVCNGSHTVVGWGSMDWTSAVAAGIAVAGIVAAVAAVGSLLAYCAYDEMKHGW
jgi:hypothetical protein